MRHKAAPLADRMVLNDLVHSWQESLPKMLQISWYGIAVGIFWRYRHVELKIRESEANDGHGKNLPGDSSISFKQMSKTD
jgi:hypothetical protein